MNQEESVSPRYYRGLNNYQYHVEVDLRFPKAWFHKEFKTVTLVTIQPS